MKFQLSRRTPLKIIAKLRRVENVEASSVSREAGHKLICRLMNEQIQLMN